MKKINRIVLGIIFAVLVGGFIWYIIPSKLCHIDVKNVKKIEVFDGNLGVRLEITDSEQIERLINAWNKVSLKKSEWILFRGNSDGIGMLVDIYLENGENKHFEITHKSNIKKDGFLQRCTKGSVEYEYIKELTEVENDREREREVWK